MKHGVAERAGSEALWHDIECGAYTADLPLWRELRDAASGRTDKRCELLELGCGTGRVSLALAGKGCRVTAIDTDPELVAVLRRRADERRLPIEAVEADARRFDLGRRFDLVLAPMQLAQLLRREQERSRMLDCVARHLEPRGRAAIALLDLAEHWEATEEAAPTPDMFEEDDWLFSSQPVAVRRLRRERVLELDRIRRTVSPGGQLSESFSRTRLALISPARLEREAGRAGLVAEPSRSIPATKDHVASTVVVLGPDA